MRYQYSSDGFQKDFYGKNKKFKLSAVNSLILINLFISSLPPKYEAPIFAPIIVADTDDKDSI